MAEVLVVDDEEAICWCVTRMAAGLGHHANAAASAEQAFETVRTCRPEAVFLDVRLPGIDGLSAMGRLREELGPVPIVIMTAYGDLGTAVEAVRNGAFDYLVKPFDLQVAERVLRRALESASHPPACSKPAVLSQKSGRLIGVTPAMHEVFKRIALVAHADSCVHITGESGTGKELVARAIHQYSHRASHPFVAVNMAALSPALAESELFGHVRGAFTGATESRGGLFEQAHGGTVFLDEIADAPVALQIKLLRALDHGEFLPVGSSTPSASNFRLISATHQNLADCVAQGDFRHDLYFRLSTFQIEIPPLRERRADIAPLAEHFVTAFSERAGAQLPLVPELLRELESRPWHGNVRELRNAIEHAIVLARGGPLLPEHLPTAAHSFPSSGLQSEPITACVRRWAESELKQVPDAQCLYDRLLRLVEPPLFEAALQQHHGQRGAAARTLGLHRMTLRKRLRELGLDDSQSEQG